MIKSIRTAKRSNEKFHELPIIKLGKLSQSGLNAIYVDIHDQKQSILGFGGAITESSAFLLSKLNQKDRTEILSAYYSENGLKYNLGRISIGSCDFGLSNYDYIADDDYTLKTFDISYEEKYILPVIREIHKLRNMPISLVASPWSPPAHFKTTKDKNNGGKLIKEYWDVYAEYLVKYVFEMRKKGADIFAFNLQNEPMATQTWDSCIFSGEEERDFIKSSLIKALNKYDLNDVKLLIWDHNRDNIVEHASIIYDDAQTNKYVWGTAYHWYVSDDYNNLSTLHKMYPDKHILFTEGCVELVNEKSHAVGMDAIGNFENGLTYARNMINDFNNFNEGFIDWNILLDNKGGPNHKNNFCEAPIMVNIDTSQIIKNYSYYVIGHFSKYVKKGAKRVQVDHSLGKDVFVTAFLNPDGKKIVVVSNQGWIKNFNLFIDGKSVTLSIPDKSITTYIID
jgi:glucosylceramidase